MELQTFTLPNGIRLVHKPVSGNVSHCGLFIGAGSRDETPEEHGIAHFIEHVIFKGTEKRNLYQVLNRLENVGADLNAYTTKEETVIHASFLNTYYERTLELISDICFHSTFPETEIRKEKEVVIDEIKSYQDTPSEQIFDDFEEQVFEGHPLGRNILGTPKNVRKFSKSQIEKFIRRNYTTDRMVISSVGNVEMKKLIRWAAKYFSQVPAIHGTADRSSFNGYSAKDIVKNMKNFQTHCIIGTPGYSAHDDRRFTLAMISNILGGPMMNSRLALALRERNGIAYNVESNYAPLTDTGIFAIYFGTGKEMLSKAVELTHKELDRLRKSKLPESQLRTAKNVVIGQLSLAQESNLNQMLSMGKSFLVLNRYTSIDDIKKIILDMTAAEILECANEILAIKRLSSLVFQS
jgi:predicted Zn-dependent peptidase